MADPTIRPSNVAMLFKIETTEGVDASPTTGDAIPFEVDGYSYNSPYRVEDSQEATGSLAASAPLVVGQPAEVSIRFRIKGVGGSSAYSASIKPPHHALYAVCGWRGVFQAAVSAAALTAGTTTSATLGTGFGTTAQMYRGMPLVLSGSGAPGTGQMPYVLDYTAGKVASLSDLFGTALSTATQAAIPANWTYAPTSPADATARGTDHPSGTLYLYEDGKLLKFTGLRGALDIEGETARPGFGSVTLMGIFAGESDAAVPTGAYGVGHSAPLLAQGVGGLDAAFLVNRRGLAISRFSLASNAEMESPDDPNTAYGFGAGIIGPRRMELDCDPLATLVATRDTLGEIAGFSQYPALVRAGNQLRNRWALVHPVVQPVTATPGKRGILRSEELKLRALNPGRDSNARDGDAILVFS